MNVNVWDVNEHIQALIRARQPVSVAALTDPGTRSNASREGWRRAVDREKCRGTKPQPATAA